ncbi:MAG TPA: dihydroorotate dehydrogenase electron transfer subunit [Dissulfurispiraceae bacterium]
MSRFFTATITGNLSLNDHFKLLSLRAGPSLAAPEPGQFYMLQAGHSSDPLLKRPFSILRFTPPQPPLARGGSEEGYSLLQFLYRVRGKGTSSLSRLREGDNLNLIGPIGNGYPAPDGDFIAVAGGVGIASLFPLLERFRGKGYLFYGARNKDELVMTDEARAVAKEMIIATDDGSEGRKGLITEAVREFLNQQSSLPLYTCGPSPMMRELSRIVAGKGIECYASLEEHMACGVGACLGCVVKIKEENTPPEPPLSKGGAGGVAYKRVCKEGPVFRIEDIVW